MHNLNVYLNLTTTIIASGLSILIINPVQAASWVRNLTVDNDSYSDTNNPNTNFGDSDFIHVGNFDNGFGSGDEQRGYLSWNLDEIISQIPAGAQVRNLNARLVLTQSSGNTDNPNPNDFNLSDPDNPVPIPRAFPGIARVTLDGLNVTGDWDESAAIDPTNPPSTINAPTLFSGQIDQGVNNYSGVGLNRLITSVLNSNTDNIQGNERDSFSVALRANNSLNFPGFGFFPGDFFESGNQDDGPRLELDFEVWNEAHQVMDGSNFFFQSRAGGDSNVNNDVSNGDWEISLGRKTGDPQRPDRYVDQNNPARQLTWRSGTNLPFELTCNPQTNQVTLTLDYEDPNLSRSTSFRTNNCQGIEGLKIFASANQTDGVVLPDTTMRIRVNQAREIGGTNQNITDFVAVSRAGQINPQTGRERVEDFFYFVDPILGGGLGFTNGINRLRGDLRMEWNGRSPQARNARSLIQTQLIPLQRVNDPNPEDISPGSGLPQPGNAETCSTIIPDEIYAVITADGSNFVIDDSICSENQIIPNSQSVPEPTSILSIILLGTTGMGVRLLKKQA